MARHPAGRHAQGMHEATIDCWCGAPGAVEVQEQTLDDNACWQVLTYQTRCLKHGLDALDTAARRLREHDRVVVMPL